MRDSLTNNKSMDSYITQLNRIYQTPPSIGSLQWCKIPVNNRSIAELESQQTATFEQLVPTLIECFAVIIGGYLSGRFRLISGNEIKGLNVFTSHISLPALIFLNLATLKLDDVNWWFIASVFLGKLVVFLGVSLVTVVVGRPINLALAGIYAIFASHSNDFGLAYPIVASLYGAKQPTYAGYLYLIAPMSLMIINPIGFVLMEAQKVREQCSPSIPNSENSIESGGKQKEVVKQSFRKKIALVFVGVITNPNVFVTILGIAANFAFKGQLPDVLYGILKVFGSAFSSSVLFLLGLRVVGAAGQVLNSGLFLPGSLLIVKMLVTPLVIRAWVTLLCAESADVEDLENYAFLYGIIPSGPVVLLFASQYGLPTEMLATTLVICTCLFGPLMFIVAKMVTLNVDGTVDYAIQMKGTLFWISVFSLVASIWVAILFLLSGKWKRSPYNITTCLVLTQCVMSIGVIFWATTWSSEPWAIYVQIFTITGGNLAARLWTAILAVTLVTLQFLPQSIVRRTLPYSLAVGFGLPMTASIALLVSASKQDQLPVLGNQLPLFLYGQNEALAAIVVLSVCLGVTFTSLLAFIRRSQHIFLSPPSQPAEKSLPITNSVSVKEQAIPKFSFDIPKIFVSKDKGVIREASSRNKVPKADCIVYMDSATLENNVAPGQGQPLPFSVKGVDIQIPLSISLKTSSPNAETRRWSFETLVYRPERSISSKDLLEETETVSTDSIFNDTSNPASSPKDIQDDQIPGIESGDIQIKSHIVILSLLFISMIVGLTVSTWKTILNVPNGIIVAVEFLDCVLTFGQGLLVFAVFGLETNIVTKYITKRIRSFSRSCPNSVVQILSLRERKNSTSSVSR